MFKSSTDTVKMYYLINNRKGTDRRGHTQVPYHWAVARSSFGNPIKREEG
jgi:hypothetical protein